MKKRIPVVIIFLILVVILTPVSFACSKTEMQEQIKLTYGSFYPPQHPHCVADQRWIDQIEKETNGLVDIEPYFAGSLITFKETLSQITSGVADICYFAPGGQHGFLIDNAEATFYYDADSWDTVVRVYKEVHDTYPRDSGFDQVKILSISSAPAAAPYQFQTMEPVRTIADLQGMIFKVGGADQVTIFKELGGDGIQMNMGEVYTSLEKNIIDGAWAPNETLNTFKFAEVTKYTTLANCRFHVFPERVMNLDTWNSLPSKIQKIFDNNSEFWANAVREEVEKAEIAGLEFAEEVGHEFIELPSEDYDKLYEVLKSVAIGKAKELDAEGLPGTEIWEMTHQLIAKYNK